MRKKNQPAAIDNGIREVLAKELNSAGARPAVRAFLLCVFCVAVTTITNGISQDWQNWFRLPLYFGFISGLSRGSYLLLLPAPKAMPESFSLDATD
jgi:hypothetical protein